LTGLGALVGVESYLGPGLTDPAAVIPLYAASRDCRVNGSATVWFNVGPGVSSDVKIYKSTNVGGSWSLVETIAASSSTDYALTGTTLNRFDLLAMSITPGAAIASSTVMVTIPVVW
jgi:hypothetical protein